MVSVITISIVHKLYMYLRKHCSNTSRPRIEPKVLGKILSPPELSNQRNTVNAKIDTQQNRMRAHLKCEVDSKLTGEVLHSYASMIVVLFCRNHFIHVYCHMLTAALKFILRRSREIVLRTLHAHPCCEIRAASGTWLST